jgi:hypothetical protein
VFYYINCFIVYSIFNTSQEAQGRVLGKREELVQDGW